MFVCSVDIGARSARPRGVSFSIVTIIMIERVQSTYRYQGNVYGL